jgi:iron complex outermembrane recepter protein
MITPPFRFRNLSLLALLLSNAIDVQATSQSATEKKASSKPIALKEISVMDKKMRGTSDPYSTEYAVPNATAATKTDTPIMETPVSIQVVPRAVMNDQQVISVGDALKNVSGVQPGAYTFYDNFMIRGFDSGQSTYRNGLRQFAITNLETANLNQIEVLKGPAAVLFGRVQPGGLVNLDTKRPLDTPYYSVQQQFGSYSLYRTTVDATGPILKDKSLLYRMNIAYTDNNTFRDFAHQEHIFIAPSLTWRPTDKFEANLDIE